ncbi:MAG: hypothetical protein WCR06_07350 [bacterium]
MKDGVVEYVILEGTVGDVQKRVGIRLDEGWVPLGGVSVAVSRSVRGELEHVVAQAMIRSPNNRKNLAMTVPMVVTGDSPLSTTVSIPGTAASDTQVSCPHCQIAIRIRNLKDGTNRCEKCLRDFVVEWGEPS